jgi:hypothetical protein
METVNRCWEAGTGRSQELIWFYTQLLGFSQSFKDIGRFTADKI